MKIAIVTDSTSDIPTALVEQYGIQVVPNNIQIDGKNLKDDIDISRDEFYRRLPHMNPLPTTGTASSGTYQELYGTLFRQGAQHILSIHASGILSGIMNAATIAAQSFHNRVSVVDSGQVTLGLGFQVLAAAEDALRELAPDKILEHLADMRKRVRVIAMLDTLDYVNRSGRVSWAKARIGNLLQIKPFIELKDGIVSSLGEARTRRKGIQRLFELLARFGDLERLGVLHTNAEGEARQVLEALQVMETLNVNLIHPPLLVNVTTVIGTHVGPNAMGFAVVTR